MNDSIEVRSARCLALRLSCAVLSAAIVQLEAIKNVDKIISNSIYILKDNLAFTGTNNIINNTVLVVASLLLLLNSSKPHPRARFLEPVLRRISFRFLASLALSQFVSNWNSPNIFEFVWPRFQLEPLVRVSVSWLPSRHILHFSVPFIDCLGVCPPVACRSCRCRCRCWLLVAGCRCHCISPAAVWLYVACLLPLWQPRHPLFWFLSTAWICKLPMKPTATSDQLRGEPLHKLQLLAEFSARCSKSFLPKCFSTSQSQSNLQSDNF